MKNYRKRLQQMLLHDMPEPFRIKVKEHLFDPETTDDTLCQLINDLKNRKKLTKPREAIDWHPRIDLEKCTRCDICHDHCPKGVYQVENKTMVVKNPTSCVLLCSKCMRNCPEEAITFPDKEAYRHYIVYT